MSAKQRQRAGRLGQLLRRSTRGRRRGLGGRGGRLRRRGCGLRSGCGLAAACGSCSRRGRACTGAATALGKGRLHFLLGHDPWRLRRDDGRRQPVVGTEVRDLRGLAVAHDLDTALVDVALREHLDAAVGANDDARAKGLCITVPFFTSVTVTGITVVFVVMVAVPAMPGFSSCTDSIFPSTLNRKSSGTVSSRVPSGSLTTSWLPSTAMTWNFLVSDVRCRLRQGDGGRQAHERTT